MTKHRQPCLDQARHRLEFSMCFVGAEVLVSQDGDPEVCQVGPTCPRSWTCVGWSVALPRPEGPSGAREPRWGVHEVWRQGSDWPERWVQEVLDLW